MGRWGTGPRGRASIVIAMTLAVLLVLRPGPTQARDFRAADTQAEDYPTVQALLFMGRLVEERTQGRHRILVFHSRQLGEEKETIEQTRAGAIDIDRVSMAPLASFAPESGVLALPFLFDSVDHLHKVVDGAIGADILASLEPHGFVGLTFYDSGTRSIYNSVRPIHTPADLAGLRIRVQQSDVAIDMMTALGAIPVALPYGQVGIGLSTGLIDGAENNWPSYVTTGHYALARHITLTEHSMTPEVLLMSQKAWAELSPEDREIFRQAALESSQFMRQEWVRWEERARRVAVESGNLIVDTVDKAPFSAAMSGVYAKALVTPGMQALVARIRAAR